MFKGLVRLETDCTDAARSKYCAKIPGPLLDPINIQTEVLQAKFNDLVKRGEGESSEKIKESVSCARERQLQRLREKNILANAQIGTKEFIVSDRSLVAKAIGGTHHWPQPKRPRL